MSERTKWNALCTSVGAMSMLVMASFASAGGDCCVANGDPGCNNEACEAAVCAIDSFCCSVSWDSICAGEAATFNVCGCGVGACPASANDCCAPSPDGTPGCNNPECCDIVCAADSFCCEVAWDSLCAGAAQGIPECNCVVGGCPKSANDCCAPSPDGTPGCNNPECCDIVCAADSFCCEVAWDSLCADAAQAIPECNCKVVPACPNPKHDCFTTGGPGCSDTACCETVCAVDSFCCEVSWDSLCVGEAKELCGGVQCNEACPTDFTFDGQTDGADLGLLLACWGPVLEGCECTDLNGDGIVDGADLGLVLAAWGPCDG